MVPSTLLAITSALLFGQHVKASTTSSASTWADWSEHTVTVAFTSTHYVCPCDDKPASTSSSASTTKTPSVTTSSSWADWNITSVSRPTDVSCKTSLGDGKLDHVPASTSTSSFTVTITSAITPTVTVLTKSSDLQNPVSDADR
jgi:hypothetical protein